MTDIYKLNIIVNYWHHKVYNDHFKQNNQFRLIPPHWINDIKYKQNEKVLIFKISKWTLMKKQSEYLLKDYIGAQKEKKYIHYNLPNFITKVYLNNKNIIGNNKYINIPIGITDGNEECISKFINVKKDKDILLYANFNRNVGIIRKYVSDVIIPNCNFIFCHNDMNRSQKLKKDYGVKPGNYPEYIKNEYYDCLTKSKFCFCLCGHEPDTFRLWEASYLGAIPIVEDIPFFKNLENDIPLVRIKDFTTITRDFLEQKYEEIQERYYPKNCLKLDYWINMLKNELY